MRPPKLTDHQKEQLSKLEPRLRNAVRMHDYESAKSITLKIQKILRPTGHETRLMKNKNWLYEGAIEAGSYDFAETGLKAIREKVSSNTRVYLEATSLLAICLLRTGKPEEAEEYIRETLLNDASIKSKKKRAEFRQHIIRRFEEEGVFNAMKNSSVGEELDPQKIQDEAGELIGRNVQDDELQRRVGASSPPEAASIILKIDTLSRKLLPMEEIKLLPSPEDGKKQEQVGRTVLEAMKRRLYASLCDPESEIYKAWARGGFHLVLSKTYIASSVIACLKGISAGSVALAVSLTALVIKYGIEVWCEVNKPSEIMLR